MPPLCHQATATAPMLHAAAAVLLCCHHQAAAATTPPPSFCRRCAATKLPPPTHCRCHCRAAAMPTPPSRCATTAAAADRTSNEWFLLAGKGGLQIIQTNNTFRGHRQTNARQGHQKFVDHACFSGQGSFFYGHK